MDLDKEVELLHMSIAEARTTKWVAGQTKYGRENGTRFVGNPLICLHSEGIDAMNYVQEASSQGLIDYDNYQYLLRKARHIVEVTRALMDLDKEVEVTK